MSSGGFTSFYEAWFEQLHELARQMTAANRSSAAERGYELEDLVNKAMSHYTEFYRLKAAAAERDVLGVFAAPWATTLEQSLHWIAGWRPTTAFHLIYSEASILFESHIIDILRGQRTGDLGDLSPSQFRRVSELQCETVRHENSITEEFSEWQDSASELLNANTDLNEKIQRLVVILRKADDLRLRTIQSVVGILTVQQALEFLIAGAELQFGVRGWGVSHERRRHND